MLQEPQFVRSAAQQGLPSPTYAYALNNPLRYTDPNGLQVPTTFPIVLPTTTTLPFGPPSPYLAALEAMWPATAHAPGWPPGSRDQVLPSDAPPLIWPESPSVPDFCAMAKGGKQNIRNHWYYAAKQQPDPCAWLRQQYQSAPAAERLEIKRAQKALECRASSGGGP